jgi:hypothetical protein
MRYLIFLGTVTFFGATTTSFAVGLTTADYDYLETQNVERTATLLRNLSPREQARLHAVINFLPATSASQAKNVAEALELFMKHQDWELSHPGELWDLPRR